MRRNVLMAGLLMGLLASSAWAERASFSVNQTQSISRGGEGDTETCVLIGFDGVEAVRSGVSVAGAQLRIPLGVDRPAGRVNLEAHPIIGSWAGFQSAFAARTEIPGGEYYREIYTRARLNPEVSDEVVFDLTGILTEMGDGLAVNGIVVTAVGGGDRGLNEDALLTLDRVEEGTLSVSYRRVNPIPERGVALGQPAGSLLID